MVRCEISCEFFGGFTTEIDLNYMESKKDICDQVKRTLITILQTNNFPALADKAEKITFHIHDFDFGHILLMEENQKLWICNHATHCDENNDKNENDDKNDENNENDDKNDDKNEDNQEKNTNPFNTVLEA
tara:strand:- start:26 stop:418 length:393 start_codon:yes stop_codon:yes gene_type:complete